MKLMKQEVNKATGWLVLGSAQSLHAEVDAMTVGTVIWKNDIVGQKKKSHLDSYKHWKHIAMHVI